MKHKLRKKQQENRDLLKKEERFEKSSQIKKRLFELPDFQSTEIILFFSSIKSEVETEEMIKEALKQGKKVSLPITDSSSKKLKIFELKKYSELSPGKFGVPEPKRNYNVKKEDLDLVIVPGVVFDLKGHRIGYGEGYYDGFLKDMGAVPKLGLSFEVQIVNEIPAEPHDVKVNKIVTEKRVIDCNDKKS